MDAKIRIEKNGPSAKITYIDALSRTHVFDAELGGNDVLLCIYAPAPTMAVTACAWLCCACGPAKRGA